MSVRMHITHSKTGNRRSHHRAGSARLVTGENGSVRMRHFADPETGTYRGKQIFSPAKAAVKAAQKVEKKAEKKSAQKQEEVQKPAEETEAEVK